MTSPPAPAVVLVGASLAGILTALALARRGIVSTLLEWSGPQPRYGLALGGVHADDIAYITGVRLAGRGGPHAHLPLSWTLVHQQLLAAASNNPFVTLHTDSPVVAVDQDDRHALAATEDGHIFRGDVLIGADGHRSIVRAAVDPDHPDATFAGYLVWLGAARKADLPPLTVWPTDTAFMPGAEGYLLGHPLPAPDGTLVPGTRQLGFTWYDAQSNDLLREAGCVLGTVVQHSLTPAMIPDQTYQGLAARAGTWPQPWRAAVLDCLERRTLVGTPVKEYVPERLTRGRLALVGDAAHVPSPITGSGFSASLADAAAMADVLDEATADAVPRALEQYERRRLAEVRRMVVDGQSFSRAFGQP